MVEAHEVKDGGVEVVDRNRVLDGFVAELVGCAIGEAFLESRTDEERSIAFGVVVAAAFA